MRIIEGKQGTPEWWAHRRGRPTSSGFDRIVTPAKGDLSKQADGYIAELIAEVYDPGYGQVDDYVSDAMARGLIMEPAARSFYEFERGVEVRQVCVVIDDDDRFLTSPDGLVGADGLVEIKSPSPKTHVGYLLDGGLPTAYRCQVHGQMIVTGWQWCDFLSYVHGFPPMLLRVERDEFTAKLAIAMAEFWPRYQAALARIEAMGIPVPAPVADEDVDVPFF